jgi:hypothetical protein
MTTIPSPEVYDVLAKAFYGQGYNSDNVREMMEVERRIAAQGFTITRAEAAMSDAELEREAEQITALASPRVIDKAYIKQEIVKLAKKFRG